MTERRGQSRIALHQGRALMLVANKYPSLPLTLVEALQNAIDAGAKHVFFGIDTRNRRRQVIVADDGRGVSEEEFAEALTKIAETRKSKNQLGRFGIGVIAPLNKCTRFTFTSWSAKSRGGPVQWLFEQSKIANGAAELRIPMARLTQMPTLGSVFGEFAKGFGPGTWRTIVNMMGITQDKVISTVSLDDLEEHFRSKLGQAMHKYGVTCRVVILGDDWVESRDIAPRAFTGDPLQPVEIKSADAGRVTFRLYIAKRINGRRQGTVHVSEEQPVYPVAWRNFAAQVRAFGWNEGTDAFNALGSGYFEGVITASKITLAPERTKFEGNDALLDLYVAIDSWYQKVGRHLYEEEKELQRDERYKELSLSVMASIRDMLRQPEFASLVDGVRSQITFGRIGEGHGTPAKLAGQDKQASTRTGQGGAGVKRQSGTGGPGGRAGGATRDGDMPTGVISTRGNRRRALVKEDSLGIWIEVTDFEFSTAVWDFDRSTGVLSFNSGSALWSELDGAGVKRRTTRNDRQLAHLQKYVVWQALSLLTVPPDQYEEYKERVNASLKQYASLFIKNAP